MQPAMLPLQGRHAFVSGATQGIGKATAIAMAAAGATVTVCGRNDQGLVRALEALPVPAAQKHWSVEVDFSSAREVAFVAAAHVKSAGPVHVLVNNTGGPPAGSAIEARAEDFVKAFEMHLLSSQALAQAFAPGMREAGYGRIVNIVSTSVVTPIRGLGVSNTVRAAVANWARTLSVELAPFGITVNSILPGFTRTARLEALFQGRAQRAGSSLQEVEADAMRLVPMGRFAAPEEIASVAAFLASPAASYVTGVNLPVDGGRLALG
ncbi:MAG: SDR family oxidoreductase [Phycisphaerales bacterium]